MIACAIPQLKVLGPYEGIINISPNPSGIFLLLREQVLISYSDNFNKYFDAELNSFRA